MFKRTGTVIANYDEGWHSYRVEVDCVTNSVDVYMDNVLVAENKSTDELNKDITGITSFGIYAISNTTDKYIYIDNYRVSSATAEPDVKIVGDNIGSVNYPLLPSSDGGVMLVCAVMKNGVLTDIKTLSATPGETPLNLSIDYVIASGETLKTFCIGTNGEFVAKTANYKHFTIDRKDCDAILKRWRSHILEDGYDINDPFVAKDVKTIGNTANSTYEIYHPEDGAEVLFGNTPVTTSAQMAKQFLYIKRLALGYATVGTKSYGDDKYKEAVLHGLEWMYENLYGQNQIDGTGWGDIEGYNWYDWFIDGPRDLIDTIIVMREYIPDEDIARYLSLYNHLSKWMSTGEDVSDKLARTYNSMAYSLLTYDGQRAIGLLDDINDVMKPVNSGQGYQYDGMYITHTAHPYIGLYGINLLVGRVLPMYEILHGTPLAMEEENLDYMFNAMKYTYLPSVHKGKMMSSLMGRVRGTTEETYEGGRTITAAVNLYNYVGDEEKEFLKWFIKLNAPAGNAYDKYSGVTPKNKMHILKAISEDDDPVEEYNFARLYYTGDRVAWHHVDSTVSLAMSSNRIFTYESINDANHDGWFTGDGMLYVYSGDNYGKQFTGNYWSKVDMAHMPGTTEDVRPRQRLSVKNEYLKDYIRPNTPAFVGGVTYDDNYVTAAMDFKGYHNEVVVEDDGSQYGGPLEVYSSDLVAKKSWFMFDDEIVALGSGINSTYNSEIRTYITNYLLDDEETVDVGRNYFQFSKGAAYMFPYGELPINVTTENGFYETYFTHGANPVNAKYAYVVLPGGMKSGYANSPDFEILSHDNNVHAVREKTLGITGMVFWKAGTFNGITVSEPVVIMISEISGRKHIKLADPTHKLTSVTVTIDGKKLVFDLSNHKGETIEKTI